MPNVRAFRAGNWSDTNPATSPWGTGGVLYAPASNDDVWLNNFNVTVDVSTTVISITNGSATSRFWKDGATTTATAGGTLALNNGVTLTANLISANSNICSMSSGSAAIVGNITSNGAGGVNLASTATLTVTGNITGGSSGNAVYLPAGSASIYVTGNVTGGDGANCRGIFNQGTGLVSVVGAVTAGGGIPASHGIFADAAGTVIVVGNCTASVSSHAISSTNANGVVRASGSFISATNGRVPVFAAIFTLNTTPSVAVTRYALSGLGTFVDMFTADNNLGQAAPTDVRSGVSYASGNLTGRLTVPARGTVASGVNLGPNMPFTATRSATTTTATATLTYSYPYQVGDVITVTGASNNEWNMDYTITEVVSGTSVRWTVPATHSATAGTGANAQTKGTAVLDGSSVAAAVWGAASRTITGGLVDTATTLTNAPASVTPSDIWSHASRTITGGTVDTLTNAPTVPSAAAIASQVRTELGTELGRIDASVSSRLASASYTAPANSDIAAIKTKTDALNTTRLGNVATVESTGAALASALTAP